jgi:hypothetical protein
LTIRRILIPLAVSAAGLAGAVGLAGAQETPGPTSPPATPSPIPAPAPGPAPGQPGPGGWEGCHHGGRDGSTPADPSLSGRRAVVETYRT